MVRILLVDDSQHVRKALRNVLETHPDWLICGEASTGHEAIEEVERCMPDIILLDFKMPDMNGLEAAKQIHERTRVPILMVTIYSSEQLNNEARRAGIQGACPKEQAKCVVRGIESLLENGGTYFPASVSRAA